MADHQRVVLGSTVGGKTVVAEPIGNRSLITLVLQGGGTMPKELSGVFSDLTSASKALESYNSARKAEEERPKRAYRTMKKYEEAESKGKS